VENSSSLEACARPTEKPMATLTGVADVTFDIVRPHRQFTAITRNTVAASISGANSVIINGHANLVLS